MAADFSRIVNTTLVNFLKKEEVNIMRQRRLLALLQEKGRLTFNWSGRETERRIRFRRAPVSDYADMDTLEFFRQDRWKLANLPWRGYVVTDSMSLQEKLMNKGDEAIINEWSNMGEWLKEDIKEHFGDQFYLDGNAAANTKKLHGNESFFGTGTLITPAAGYKAPSDNYANLDTDPSKYGGTWTGSWPDGTGDVHYDFYSPIILDYTHATAWSDGTTFALNCIQTIGHAIIKCQRSGLQEGMLDFILMGGDLYPQYLDKARAKERIIVDRGRDSKLVSLGFKDVVNQDGTDITWEYGVPASTVYGFNVDKEELMSLHSQLFGVTGPTESQDTLSWRVAVWFLGNMWWNPKFHLKMKNFT